jgi:predicted metal-dependent hydrolase
MGDGDHDPRYLGYFESFSRRRFFEAHEVLETLWQPERQGPNGAFYKGLIQLAGAFVHWQKNRPGPAVSLFELAQANPRKYPATHEGLNVTGVLTAINKWLRQLMAAAPGACPPVPTRTPELRLGTPTHARDRRNGVD